MLNPSSKKMVFVFLFTLNLGLLFTPATAMDVAPNQRSQKELQIISERVDYYYQNFDKFWEFISLDSSDSSDSSNSESDNLRSINIEDINVENLNILKMEMNKENKKAKLLYFYVMTRIDQANPTEWLDIHSWLVSQGDDPNALSWLGCFEREKWEGHPAEPGKAEAYFFKAVERGNFLSFLHLASLYREGWEDHPADPEKATEYYIKAANNGFPLAYSILATLYEEGWKGQPADLEKAVEFYILADKNGDPSACLSLAELYNEGWEGHPADPEKAIEYYIKAAVSVDSCCYLKVGAFYLKGCWEGHPADFVKAEEYYLKAAEAGHTEAYSPLGFMCSQHGLEGQFRDLKKAEKYYLMAAASGASEAYSALGDLYSEGWEGHPADFAKAEEYYLKAAEGDYTQALQSLGRMFAHGLEGQFRDLKKAEKYYLMAAASGALEAYSALGDLYSEGWEGRPADLVKAEEYFLKAVGSGDFSVCLSLFKLYKKGWEGHPAEQKKAEYWFTKAVESGDFTAYASLGVYYHDGWDGHSAEPEKAVHWFTKILKAKTFSRDRVVNLFKKTLMAYLIPPQPAEVNLAISPTFLPLRKEETAESIERWESACSCLQPMVGKMMWKCGEYSQEGSMKTNERKTHKPEGHIHYKKFGDILVNATKLLPKTLEENSFVFMTPKTAVQQYLCTNFKFFDPLASKCSDQVGLRLYNVCNGTVLAFGNKNVKLADEVMNLLEGQDSIAALIARHQKNLNLLEKLKTQKKMNVQLDEESNRLVKHILTKPERKYAWGGAEPKPSFSDFLATILEKTYNTKQEATREAIEKKLAGKPVHPLIDQHIESEILEHIDFKIKKRSEKIGFLKEIVDNFQGMVKISQPKKLARFKEKYSDLGDMFN